MRGFIAVFFGAALVGCGGAQPSSPTPAAPTPGAAVQVSYSVQLDDGNEICTLSRAGATGSTVVIDQAALSAGSCGNAHDGRYMVLTELPDAQGNSGKQLARSTTGQIMDTLSPGNRVLYLARRVDGLDLACVFAAGWTGSLRHGATISFEEMAAGSAFPRGGGVDSVVQGGFSEAIAGARDLLIAGATNVRGVRYITYASGGSPIRAAVVNTLGSDPLSGATATGWHTSTGYVGVITFPNLQSKKAILAVEAIEEQGGNNPCGMPGTDFFFSADRVQFTARGSVAYHMIALFGKR